MHSKYIGSQYGPQVTPSPKADQRMSAVNNIRHELRTPLNHIIGYSEILLEELDAEGAGELRAEFQAICKRGKELLALVNWPVTIDEHNLVGIFGNWRTPLQQLLDILQAAGPSVLKRSSQFISDVAKVEEAAHHLRELFERIEGPFGHEDAKHLSTEGSDVIQGKGVSLVADSDQVKGRLLVVDDNEVNLELMQRRLTREGYGIAVAANGNSALEFVTREDFDVILLDVIMPGISGIDVLKRIRQHYSSFQLPIIMVTARHSSSSIVEALELGANDYITKPVDFPVALARISTQLYLKRVTRELAKANKQLYHLSYMDGLTGIPNRRNLDDYLKREIGRAQREGEALAVIMLDVDYFKLYNDNYGHEAGDQALIKVAQALAGTLSRPGDFVARYGGEEFVVVLPKTSGEPADRLAERLRKAVEELAIPHAEHRSEDHLTISLGVASVVPQGEITAEQLLVLADQALYHAKLNGRNRVMSG